MFVQDLVVKNMIFERVKNWLDTCVLDSNFIFSEASMSKFLISNTSSTYFRTQYILIDYSFLSNPELAKFKYTTQVFILGSLENETSHFLLYFQIVFSCRIAHLPIVPRLLGYPIHYCVRNFEVNHTKSKLSKN